MPLTARQQQFVAAYLVEPNATAAARAAGYSAAKQAGCRLLARPAVAAAVSAAQADRAAQAGLDAAWIIQRLKAAALDREPGSSHGARVAALGLLGKHLGMFTDRVEVTERVRVVVTEELVDAVGPAGPTGDRP